MIRNMKQADGVEPIAIEVHRLENVADDLMNSAVAALFREEDPVTIIKFKEITEVLEQATDHCEDVANVLSDIVAKNQLRLRRPLPGKRRDARRYGPGMADPFTMIILAALIVFTFDFFNGFHDAANAIATVVATKVLTPTRAVAMAAVGNFVGMVFITNAIAETIGKGIVDTSVFLPHAPPLSGTEFLHAMVIILAGVLGAIVWDIITWWWGLPTSSSHALIGGLIGSTILAGGASAVL